MCALLRRGAAPKRSRGSRELCFHCFPHLILLHQLILPRYRVVSTMPTSSLEPLTLTKYPGYVGLRSCVADCVAGYDFANDGLIGFIGCPYPLYNTCYCNSNIIPEGSSFLSTCVTSRCSESADVPAAFSVWTGYCDAAGFPMNAAAQTTAAAATSSGTTLATTTNAAIGATTQAPTPVATTATSISTFTTGGRTFTTSISSVATTASLGPQTEASGSQLNVGAIAGGSVGVAIVLGVVAIIIAMMVLKHRRQRPSNPAPPPVTQPTVFYPLADPDIDRRRAKNPVIIHTDPMNAPDRTENNPMSTGRVTMGNELDGEGRSPWRELQG